MRAGYLRRPALRTARQIVLSARNDILGIEEPALAGTLAAQYVKKISRVRLLTFC